MNKILLINKNNKNVNKVLNTLNKNFNDYFITKIDDNKLTKIINLIFEILYELFYQNSFNNIKEYKDYFIKLSIKKITLYTIAIKNMYGYLTYNDIRIIYDYLIDNIYTNFNLYYYSFIKITNVYINTVNITNIQLPKNLNLNDCHQLNELEEREFIKLLENNFIIDENIIENDNKLKEEDINNEKFKIIELVLTKKLEKLNEEINFKLNKIT